jgi:hypothetical protein
MSIAISVSMMVSVSQVLLNPSQQMTSDYQLECEGMKGRSCTSGAEMGGMNTTFWELDNKIHLSLQPFQD